MGILQGMQGVMGRGGKRGGFGLGQLYTRALDYFAGT